MSLSWPNQKNRYKRIETVREPTGVNDAILRTEEVFSSTKRDMYKFVNTYNQYILVNFKFIRKSGSKDHYKFLMCINFLRPFERKRP